MGPLVAVALLLAALPGSAAATARFSNVFGSQMVLQRDQPIELWGFNAAPDASQLTVHWGSAAAEVYWPVSADGSWRALLPALPAAPCNGTALVLKSAGVAVDTLADVCIGDVYLFSGQSNIDIPQAYGHQFSPAAQAADEAFADANPDIRLMIVPNQVPGLNYQETPAKELAVVPDCPLCGPPFDSAGKYNYCQCNTLRWARANGTVVRGFSATAWFTGKCVQQRSACGCAAATSDRDRGCEQGAAQGRRRARAAGPHPLVVGRHEDSGVELRGGDCRVHPGGAGAARHDDQALRQHDPAAGGPELQGGDVVSTTVQLILWLAPGVSNEGGSVGEI